MNSKSEADVDSRVRSKLVQLFRYVFAILMIGVGALVAGAVSGAVRGVVRNLVGPRFDAWTISQLLKSEPYYVEKYSLDEDSPEPFRFTVHPSNSERELVIQPIQRDGTIRVFGKTKLDPGVLAILLDHDDARRDLETQIETALVSTKVVYQFVDSDSEATDLQGAQEVFVEYRIYDLSRRRLFDGIVEVENTLDFIEARANSVAERYRDYS